MDRGAWRVTVVRVAELNMTEAHRHMTQCSILPHLTASSDTEIPQLTKVNIVTQPSNVLHPAAE